MVHKSAYIDKNVIIGQGTKIWHFSHIMEGSCIGNNCNIGQNVFVGRNVQIGNNCKIQNNVSVFEGVRIQNDVFIGPSVTFTNVYNPRAFINKMKERKPTLIKTGATIGANSTIICGNTIGRYSFIGAATLIRTDTEDFSLYVGVPGIRKKWICICGESLLFKSNITTCYKCQKIYERVATNEVKFVR